MNDALTDAERDLLDLWFNEKTDPYAARQRAWEVVARRARRGQPDLLVRW